jgi:hypothetical protein
MAYEYERDEYRAAVAALTETDRAATNHSVRASVGMCGDKEDAKYE